MKALFLFYPSVSVPSQALCPFSFTMFVQLTLCPDSWLMFTDWNSEVEINKDFLIKIKTNDMLLVQQIVFR